MNKLFNKIAAGVVGLAMAVGVGVAIGSQSKAESRSVKAADVLAYTLDGTITGGNNNYANASSITQSGVAWSVYGNTMENPWRIGGKSITNTSRKVQSSAAVSSQNISKVVLEVGTANSVTVNSLTLMVGTASGGSQTSTVTGTFAANSTITFSRPSGKDWTSKFFTFDFNLTISSTSNKFVQFKSAKFYYESGGSVVNVTGVSVAPTTATIKVGKTVALTPTVSPSNATDKSVSWTSSDTTVATVNSEGTVTGVAAGSATITCTTTDGGKTATCGVTVQAIETINATVAQARTAAAALTDGDTTADLYCVTGYVTNVSYTWTSSNGVSFSMADAKDGTPTLDAFKIKCSQEIGLKVLKDAQLTVTGNLKNYGGTYEVINNSGVATPITILQEAGAEYPEPALVTGQELSDLFANTDGNYKQLYQVTGVVSAWYNTNTDGTKYGNFYLQEPGDTSTSYLIYGATATADRLIWNSGAGNYVFSNPQDFLTNETTKNIVIGDTVTMKLTRCDYNSTLEAQGIVVSVTHAPTISVSPATLSLATGESRALTVTKENDGGATVSWSTSDATVATVTAGTVTAVAIGSANITASITVSGVTYSATCAVTVTAPVQALVSVGDQVLIYYDTHYLISMNSSSYGNQGSESDAMVFTICSGSSSGTFAFENDGQYLTWPTGNALDFDTEIDDYSSWTITGESLAECTIANAYDSTRILQYNSNSPRFACYTGSQHDAHLQLVDASAVASVTLNKHSVTLAINAQDTLSATIAPSTATTQTVKWLTSSASVATVSSGTVTAVAVGLATITAYADENNNNILDTGEKYDECIVTVTSGQPASAYYEKVTATSGLEDGSYLVVYEAGEGAGLALDGRLSADQASNGVTVTISDNKIESTALMDAIAFTFDADDGTFLGGSNYYFYHSGTKNTLNYTQDASAAANTVTISDGSASIVCGDYVLRYNAASGQERFRYYTSGQQDVQLYKYVEESASYTASDFATEFLTTLSTGQSHVCVADGSTNLSSLKAAWKTLAGKWDDVSDKATITGATASESGNDYQKTKALYIYIAEKYNTQLQDSELTDYNFMGIQGLNPRSNSRVSVFGDVDTQSGTAIAITVASILSVAALGGYFFIKKKKVTK